MNKTNPYLQQLNTAIDSTRNQLLVELNQAQSARDTALSARDYAGSDKWAAYKEMGLNEQVLVVASRIEEMAAGTQLLARNLTLFAKESQTDAAQAQSDMADAAAAIKNAAGAMETLTRGVHDAASVTKSKDAGDHINDDAIAASRAVEKCMTAVDHLQTQSLKCSISASKPLAGSVAQTFSVLGDQVVSLVTDTTLARDVARQEVAATTANRNRTWSRYFTQIPPFERQLQARNGLLKSFAEIDKLANYDLKVRVANYKPEHAEEETTAKANGKKTPVESKDQTGMAPGILAEVVVPADDSDQYLTPQFFAVKELDAATFSFSESSKGKRAHRKPEPKTESKPAAKGEKNGAEKVSHPDVSYSALLQVDNKGDPIKFGETYRIFMKQELNLKKELKLQQEHDEDSHEISVMHAPRHSLPSQPIMSTFTFDKHPHAPKIMRLCCDGTNGPADPLLVAFTLPAAPAPHVSYRAIIVPSILWSNHLEDEQFLIERANPAVYAKLEFDHLSHPTKKIADQITDRFAADLKILLPIGDQESVKKAAHKLIKDKLDEIGADALSHTALVYYSPVRSSDDQPHAKVTVPGDYLDMYGGLINLTNDSYRIGVLAWLDDPDTATTSPCVSALVGESKPIGVRTPHYEGSGPEESPPAPATPSTPAA